MAQIFHRSMNVVARVSLLLAPVALAVIAGALGILYRSSFFTAVFHARRQPVPFSHKHHVGALGIDCRYCHDSVEESAFAGMPALETCMGCHSQIWADSPLLSAVREGYRTNRSIVWTRVTKLPDYVYFNHSIHIHRGISCATCHGKVDEMPLTFLRHTLSMKCCLKCHQAPERYHVAKQGLTDCYVCHR